MTLGDYRVGIDFNPSGNAKVAFLKTTTANLIDLCHDLGLAASDPEIKRLFALAKTTYEEAAMWAVKAVTKSPRPSDGAD